MMSTGLMRGLPRAGGSSSCVAMPRVGSTHLRRRASTCATPCTSTGADHTPSENGTIYLTNWVDQRIYRQHPDGAIEPLTDAPPIPRGVRFADLSLTPNGKFLLCVRETHTDDGNEAANEIVAIDTSTGDAHIVATGRDFYCAPRVAANHDGIVWTEWDHPNMPWDGNSLVSGSFNQNDATVSTTARLIDDTGESVVQPTWNHNGILHFVTDRTGWWNIHLWKDGEPINLLNEQSDYGRPDWQFAFTSYAHLPDHRIALGKGGVTDGSILIMDTESHHLPHSISSPLQRNLIHHRWSRQRNHSLCWSIAHPGTRHRQPRSRNRDLLHYLRP